MPAANPNFENHEERLSVARRAAKILTNKYGRQTTCTMFALLTAIPAITKGEAEVIVNSEVNNRIAEGTL